MRKIKEVNLGLIWLFKFMKGRLRAEGDGGHWVG